MDGINDNKKEPDNLGPTVKKLIVYSDCDTVYTITWDQYEMSFLELLILGYNTPDNTGS